MFDHLSLGVADLQRAAAFYDAVMTALGQVRLWENPRSICYGPEGFAGEAPLAIVQHGADAAAPGAGFHLALRAADRAAVDRFHAAALAHGGQDEGAPGIRLHYNPGYYAAFVRDPDGHRLEAVCHEPVSQEDGAQEDGAHGLGPGAPSPPAPGPGEPEPHALGPGEPEPHTVGLAEPEPPALGPGEPAAEKPAPADAGLVPDPTPGD